MLNKVFTILWNLGAALFWSGLLLYAGMWAFGSSGCTFDEYQSVYSPDRTMRAVVINADCGATTNWQTQVFVEKVDGSKKTASLLRLDGQPEALNVAIGWLDNDELLISEFAFEKILEVKQQDWGPDFVKVHFKVKSS